MSINDPSCSKQQVPNLYPELPKENLYPILDVPLDIANYSKESDRAKELRVKFFNQWNSSVEIENQHSLIKPGIQKSKLI